MRIHECALRQDRNRDSLQIERDASTGKCRTSLTANGKIEGIQRDSRNTNAEGKNISYRASARVTLAVVFRAISLIHVNGMPLNSFTALLHAESRHYARTVVRASVLDDSNLRM